MRARDGPVRGLGALLNSIQLGSLTDRTCAATREDATRTSGRESRGSAGSPRRRRAARRARAARTAARRGRRLAGRRVGGRAGGRRARAARVELSSILGGLTARTQGTPAHLRQSLHLPSLHLGWKAAPRRLWCIGARRALGIVAAIWGRRGMVGGTTVINRAFNNQGTYHPSQNSLRKREREERMTRDERVAERRGHRGPPRPPRRGGSTWVRFPGHFTRCNITPLRPRII